VALVSESARRARCRLQFYRFAYGFSLGLQYRRPGTARNRRRLFAATNISGDYAEGIRMLSPDWQKLACNLLSVGVDAVAARRPSGFNRWPAQPRSGRRALRLCPLKRVRR